MATQEQEHLFPPSVAYFPVLKPKTMNAFKHSGNNIPPIDMQLMKKTLSIACLSRRKLSPSINGCTLLVRVTQLHCCFSFLHVLYNWSMVFTCFSEVAEVAVGDLEKVCACAVAAKKLVLTTLEEELDEETTRSMRSVLRKDIIMTNIHGTASLPKHIIFWN